MEGDDNKNSNNDKVELEDCILTVEDGCYCRNVQCTADSFVVVPEK